MTGFCKKCGAALEPGAKTCSRCGAPVEDDEYRPAPSSNSNIAVVNLGILVAGVVLILSTFLPYVSVSVFGFTQSASLIEGGDGAIFIALGIAAIACAVLKKPLPTLVAGVAAALLSFVELADANSKLGDYAAFVSKGMGFYLNLLAAIALAVLCVLFFLAEKKKK